MHKRAYAEVIGSKSVATEGNVLCPKCHGHYYQQGVEVYGKAGRLCPVCKGYGQIPKDTNHEVQ